MVVSGESEAGKTIRPGYGTRGRLDIDDIGLGAKGRFLGFFANIDEMLVDINEWA